MEEESKSIENNNEFFVIQNNQDSFSIIFNKKVINLEEFYNAYFSVLISLNKINANQSEIKLLSKFCIMADCNTGILHVPAGIRKKIASDLNIKQTNFNNLLFNLKVSNCIELTEGTIKINPLYLIKFNKND